MNSVVKTVGGRVKISGFTLLELMVTVMIIGVLVGIAYPSYINSVTRTKRKTAEACLSSYATYMERFYTTNMRYDRDVSGAAITWPVLDCATTQNSGKEYVFSLGAASGTTYSIQAAPQGAQSTRDAQCGTLTLDQSGTRTVSGTAGTSQCW